MNICVYGAASSWISKKFIESGKELGRKIVKRGHGLVFGGGAHGMMGAVAEGANEEKGEIIGVIPEFFKEGGEEISYKNCTKYIYTDTMRERKKELAENSNAFIVSPGGIGTLDEFFEILTLKQLGRHNKAIVVYNVDGFYDALDIWIENAIKEEFITSDTKDLYKVFDDEDKMLDYIENYDEKDIDLSRVKIR